MANIQIIVGSVMGTAKEIAKRAEELLSSNHQVTLNHAFKKGDLNKGQAVLICTSNTGVGDLPTSIAPLLKHLLEDKPPLDNWKYGLINLGDSHYPSFAEAGKKLDSAMSELGAINTTSPLLFDASEGKPSMGELKIWLQEWVATL